MPDLNTDEPDAAQEAGADPSPVVTGPFLPGVRYVYCPRTGNPIPAALAEEREARQRALNTPAKQRSRERQRASEAAMMADVAAALADLDMTESRRLPLAVMRTEARRLKTWLESDGPRQRQYRPKAKRYLAARIALLTMRREMEMTDDDPDPAEFAPCLARALNEPISKDMSRDMLRALVKLEGEGGPWGPASS